ncbi:hypothetical protein JMJ77_0002145 [Colletotrichum scovillei]|uniref:Uncharacterized protein n=1 Tax=Colletotrichum scovillei TaxID=1209932 RepID=A0A9P7R8F7_9PEZI|nr:hypothetical protein JMJ77_0002145 [Colletotrichum scovillei]KAG7070561.1 hypothetical protein JMJ76_0001810 [Colletotrichum scovillei]KAG7078812.1 hypothetical protein JMJ78_0002477 [Colletotrichum scovillei]
MIDPRRFFTLPSDIHYTRLPLHSSSHSPYH